MDQERNAVLSEFAEADAGFTATPVGTSSGFSDARLWRVETAVGAFALRRWPVGQPTAPRRAFLHRFLRFVRDRGLEWIAAPIRTRHGATFVERAGRNWELDPWLPGTADFSPTVRPEKVAAAMQALAQFHRMSALFPPGPTPQPAPGIVDRDSLVRLLVHGEANNLRQAVQAAAENPSHPASIIHKSHEIMDLFTQCAPTIAGELAGQTMTVVPVLPCLRDVWREHVLFEGDKVTGIIDYGALRTDSVAADVARLLGSYLGDNRPAWEEGISAYQRVRKLSDAERSLVELYDRSAVLLSGTYWVRWIFVDGIKFPDLERVELRMDEWLGRLRHLSGTLPGGLHFS